MNILNTILLNQPTQSLLVFNIFLVFNLIGTLIHYIKQHNHFLKFSFDCIVFIITCCIGMGNFSNTLKDVILVTFYKAQCLQNKTFVDRA